MKFFQKRWVWGVGCGVFLLWLLLQGGAMFFHVGEGFFRPFTRFVLPPAWVTFTPVSYKRVAETAHAFVALHVASSYEDAFPLALAFVVRDVRLRQLLGDGGISSADVFTSVDQDLLRAAGISLREQERYLAVPLLRLRTARSLRDEMLPSQELRMQSVLEKVELGMPFVDIARYFSEDSSALTGGDLGIFLLSELPVWAQAVAYMQVGEVRADFVGTDAFWVLKVVDVGGADEDAWVHLRGVAINKPTLGAVLRAHAGDHPAWVLVW